jgi:hypothetical protein
MARELARIAPIPLPTERAATPSWPAWLTSRVSAMARNEQRDPATGQWTELMALPADQMLTAAERAAIERHHQCLTSLLDLTPLKSEAADKATYAAISELLLAKPARAGGPETAKARAKTYIAALDDVPTFAVFMAIRKWYRGECDRPYELGNEKRYDYTWAPDSADLRTLALREMKPVQLRAAQLTALLAAPAFVDTSAEREAELGRGQAALAAILYAAANGDPPLASFDEAVRVGERLLTNPNARKLTPEWLKRMPPLEAETEATP